MQIYCKAYDTNSQLICCLHRNDYCLSNYSPPCDGNDLKLIPSSGTPSVILWVALCQFGLWTTTRVACIDHRKAEVLETTHQHSWIDQPYGTLKTDWPAWFVGKTPQPIPHHHLAHLKVLVNPFIKDWCCWQETFQLKILLAGQQLHTTSGPWWCRSTSFISTQCIF